MGIWCSFSRPPICRSKELKTPRRDSPLDTWGRPDSRTTGVIVGRVIIRDRIHRKKWIDRKYIKKDAPEGKKGFVDQCEFENTVPDFLPWLFKGSTEHSERTPGLPYEEPFYKSIVTCQSFILYTPWVTNLSLPFRSGPQDLKSWWYHQNTGRYHIFTSHGGDQEVSGWQNGIQGQRRLLEQWVEREFPWIGSTRWSSFPLPRNIKIWWS